jgi:Protein of unknown function (DUF2971)
MSSSILLYRYLDYEAAIKTIEKRRFRVGRIKEFNDPFEWRLGIEGIVPEGEEFAQTVMDSFIDDMNSQFGIICFSSTCVDSVLWAHYADNHQGMAFEVEHTLDPEALSEVTYSNDRPLFDANELHRLCDFSDWSQYFGPLLKKVLHQKALGWSYEKEHRVHVELAKCEASSGHYFRQIPDEFLKRVILGFRCPIDVPYVRKALDQAGLGATEVLRARMDQRTYQILC